jgi:hypothetical protein
MPWPDQIGLLLARPESRASQALRWGLRGLRGSLEAALEDDSDGTGCKELRELLAELHALLAGGAPAPSSTLPLDSPGSTLPDDRSTGVPRLLSLASAVAAEARLAAELGRSPIRDGSDDEIWKDVQHLLLRIGPDLAEEWRRRTCTHAENAGGRLDPARTTALPLARDEVIYPGLTGEVQTTGLRSSADAPLDPRIAAPADDDLRFVAGAVSTCLWFIDNDPHLCHCLKSVFRFGVSPLTPVQRMRYVAELTRLWQRVNVPGKGPKERLKALLDLDEAIHSLVHQPLAVSDSWWGRLQSQARDALFAARDRAVQAGCAVHLQLLGGSFAAINQLAPDSLQVDFGVPGEVSACLRLWARIEREELKGRVLYRSPQEEA